MPTDIADLNPPPSDLAPSQSIYAHKVKRITLTDGQRQRMFLPYKVNFQPTTIILDTITGVTLEVTCSSNDVLNTSGGSGAIWFALTLSTARVILTEPYTAIRLTRAGGPVNADVLA